ncbi:MAG: NUDIX domain-containing protein [Acidobacteriota bacterium]
MTVSIQLPVTVHESRITHHASRILPFDMKEQKKPIPAAAVAFVRDTERGIEIYLSRRPAHFRYYPGAFVFPGGRSDPGDTDIKATARREVQEEIGIEIDTQRLVPLRNIHTSAHAGPVYHMLTFAYPAESEFNTSLNPEEVEEEMWIMAREALARFELPYQIRAAVYTIARFASVADLLGALAEGSIDEDYWI